jgi:hypothetical protein
MSHRNERGQFRRAQPEDLSREHGASLAEFLNSRKPPPPAWLVPTSLSSLADPDQSVVDRGLRQTGARHIPRT